MSSGERLKTMAGLQSRLDEFKKAFESGRDLILALTADEESSTENGVKWLLQNHRRLDRRRPLPQRRWGCRKCAGEVPAQRPPNEPEESSRFGLEVKNKGGHSSRRTSGGSPGNRRTSSAIQRLSPSPLYNALMRTTCVPTRVDAGHADNALPQTARATISCRILAHPLGACCQAALGLHASRASQATVWL